MRDKPRFAKTAEYKHSGSERRIRAESSVSVHGGLFVRVDADRMSAYRDGFGQAINLNRSEVEEFRDFLTEWLDVTEVKIPTTPGSVIVDHRDGTRYCPPRTYVLTPRSNTYLKDHEALRIPENVWSMVDGPGVPGWETDAALADYVRSGRAEVKYDAGAE